MSPVKAAVTTCEIYDHALKYCRNFRVLPGTPQPDYTCTWLPENIAALERYRVWLQGGGTSAMVIRTYHIPMAGHALGMNHKPSCQLDLDTFLWKALDYIHAKGHGPSWTKNCRNSLLKFRFLLHERGQVECKKTPYDPAPHTEDLPDWLVENLSRWQHVQQRNWREARVEENIRRFWCGHLRLWRFLCERFSIRELTDLKRSYFMEYIDWRLKAKASPRGVNGDLRTFHGFMAFLQEQGWPVPQALFRVPCLKEPDPLPKYLTDTQVRALRDEFERGVIVAEDYAHLRMALLDRACFYLLWQAGMRRGEVEDLRLEDLNLEGRRLTVRRGKGLLDRTVFLTDTVVVALKTYLEARGPGPTDHVFLYRNQALSKDLIHGRLKACGARVGVSVYAHRLRHTCATQLLNAGCRITSIQKFLGHKRLDTTLTYARAHDQSVAEDYFTAMGSVEKRLDLLGEEIEKTAQPVREEERSELMALAGQLAQPEVSVEKRMEIAFRMCEILRGIPAKTQNENGRMQWESPCSCKEHPPLSSGPWG